MKKTVLFIASLLVLASLAKAQVVLSPKTDDRFVGFYVDVDSTTANLKKVSSTFRLEHALKLQIALRECLQDKSQSHLRKVQEAFLNQCLNITNALIPEMKKTLTYTPYKGFIVAFDMDETLLTQWSEVGLKFPEKTTLIAKSRDFTFSEKEGLMYVAPKGVMIRPGAKKLLEDLAKHPRVNKIYFFSAREDKSAKELKNYFLEKIPSLKKKYGGVFARNSLRLDQATNTPSKDLRLISPDLSNIILIDDNPGRVMQKELNFSIPKFNTDLYVLGKENRDQDILKANALVMPFIYELVNFVTNQRNVPKAFYPFSTKRAELDKIDWGHEILKWGSMSEATIETLLKNKVFDQPFFIGETIHVH